MFGWLRRIFAGSVKSTGEPVVITETMKAGTVTSVINTVEEKVAVEETPKPKKAAKPKAKKTTKKKAVEDFSALSKKGLLEEAKARGIKANASLKKEELIERLKSA